MTVYITYEDLAANYTEQEFPEGADGLPDADYIQECCKGAAVIIDGVLRNAGVEFPVSAATIQELEYTALCIARHRYLTRGGMTPSVQKEKDDAMEYLEKIRLNINTLSSIPTQGGLYTVKFKWGG